MIYEYACEECQIIIEESFPMGEAPSFLICNDCRNVCSRYYGAMNFVLKGGGWPGKTLSRNKKETEKNIDAGDRMEESWGHTRPKLVNEKDGSPYSLEK